MPRVAEFFGIIIEMYFRDHSPPHVHAKYAGYEALFAIATGKVIAGSLPAKQVALVTTWILTNQKDLATRWEEHK